MTHRVVIEQFAFVPETLTIKQGDRVEWINRDIVPHTATAESGAWDTETLDQDQAAAIPFETAGTVRYICAHHPVMRGKIVVTPR